MVSDCGLHLVSVYLLHRSFTTYSFVQDNYPEPFKRPLSSTVPAILEHGDGSFFLSTGGSGGARIFPSVFQVLVNLLHFERDLSEAIESGRMHDQLWPQIVDIDDTYPLDLAEGLRGRGHNVTISDVNRVAAVVQAVMKPEGANGIIFGKSY
jgi:gamma-glutamyltranspeptidase / glutathione hydrolase / leukotriene-C4 hydrolase